MKILMVCLGNICRSPMAEGIMRHKLNENGIDGVVDSCGTSGWHIGESPDRRAESTLHSKGIDISALRARQFQMSDFDEFDLIYTMDSSNHDDILGLSSSEAHSSKVRMILEETHPGSQKPVPDPYYGGDDGFELVFSLLDEACDIITSNL